MMMTVLAQPAARHRRLPRWGPQLRHRTHRPCVLERRRRPVPPRRLIVLIHGAQRQQQPLRRHKYRSQAMESLGNRSRAMASPGNGVRTSGAGSGRVGRKANRQPRRISTPIEISQILRPFRDSESTTERGGPPRRDGSCRLTTHRASKGTD